MEKEIWRWLLETYSDEGIANIGENLGIKVAGFRHIKPQQKNFKILRPKLIQEILHPKNTPNLINFFQTLSEEATDLQKYRGESTESLLQFIEEEEVSPSILLSVLMSSEDEEDIEKAQELFVQLREEKRLNLLEDQINGLIEEQDELNQDSGLKELQAELKLAQQKGASLERKLKKSEQKNEELKGKALTDQDSFKREKKLWKEEKKGLTVENQELKAEKGSLINQLAALTPEKESLQKQISEQTTSLKKKDDEIARLNALLLKLKTEQQKGSVSPLADKEVQEPPVQIEETKLKVAVIGDPKNTRVQRYNKFELIIIDAAEIQAEKNNEVLNRAEQIWLLTYKTPKGIQKRVRSLIKDKEIYEFATFIDLENYMVKG